MALSPDGKSVVTIGQNDDLIAWDSVTGKQRWKRTVPAGPMSAYGVRAFAFSESSDIFYSFSQPDFIESWNLADGATSEILVEHHLPMTAKNRPIGALPGTTRSVDVTRDGKRIAIAGAHGVAVFDAQGELLFEIANSPMESMDSLNLNADRLLVGGHYSLAIFSPDGGTLAVVTSEFPAQVRLFDATAGNELKRIPLSARLVRMAFSLNGESLVTTERDCAIRHYSNATGDREWELVLAPMDRFESYTCAIAYSPDGKRVAVCAPIGTNHWIYVLDGSSGAIDAVLKGHTDKPCGVAFTADSKTLYSSGWDGNIRRWNLESFQQLDSPSGVLGSPAIAAAPVGKRIAHADERGDVHVVDAINGNEQMRLKNLDARVSQLVFDLKGELLAVGGSNDSDVFVTVWEVGSEHISQHWQWPKGEDPRSTVTAIEFSPNQQRLVAAVSGQNRSLMWEVASGKQIAELPHEDVRGVSYCPDGLSLVTGGLNQHLCFWKGDTGEQIHKHEFKEDETNPQDLRMNAIRFSPRGDTFATANLDGMLRIWNRNDTSLKSKIQMKSSFDHGALSYSPDGKWLATGNSNEVCIWDPQSGELMWSTVAHQGSTYSVGFGDSGRFLVSGGEEGVGYCLDFIPSEATGDPDYESLWQDLARTDANIARKAVWAMIQIGDPAVAEVGRRLSVVRFILDLKSIANGLEPIEASRRLRLAMQLVETDPKVDSQLRLHNALTFVARLNTPVAVALLQQYAQKHACEDVQREAATLIRGASAR